MKKAYWVGIINVKDQEEYKKYTDIAGHAIIASGAKILSRGGKIINLEGQNLNELLLLNFHQWIMQKNFICLMNIELRYSM